jgi:hypothetical protein
MIIRCDRSSRFPNDAIDEMDEFEAPDLAQCILNELNPHIVSSVKSAVEKCKPGWQKLLQHSSYLKVFNEP